MITHATLQAWVKRRHHPELADRLRPETDGISYDQWRELDELTARIRLDESGLTSAGFREQTEELLRAACADAGVVDALRAVARTGPGLSTGRPEARQVARRVAIALSWLVWLAALLVAMTTRVPQWVVILLFFLGFVPYIVCIQLVEPWLDRRQKQ